jgi:hypothetical protein
MARYYSYWGYFSPENYRVMKSFKYSGQAKKEEDPRQAWRQHKKVAKDKSKNGYRRSCKGVKEFGARSHRSLERQMMSRGRYDDLHRLTYKYAENPWSWD